MRARLGQRRPHFGDPHDLTAERDVVAPLSIGVTRAVEAFVVLEHEPDGRTEVLHRLEDLGSLSTVMRDHLVLLRIQLPRFVQDSIGNRDHADVV